MIVAFSLKLNRGRPRWVQFDRRHRFVCSLLISQSPSTEPLRWNSREDLGNVKSFQVASQDDTGC